MEYYFDEIDPFKFQRLINTILVARFGEDIRLTPLRGKDGGRDGETAAGNPYFEFQVAEGEPLPLLPSPPRPGRYLFQVKHHRTSEGVTEGRRAVISEFSKELANNVLTRDEKERVNYFFLVTNVSSSGDALEKVDQVRRTLLKNVGPLHADVWWKERVMAHLDSMPTVWSSFPEIFAGGIVPLLGQIVSQRPEGLPRAIRIAIARQYSQDKMVKFRQIELEKTLAKLFVDLDIDVQSLPPTDQQELLSEQLQLPEPYIDEEMARAAVLKEYQYRIRRRHISISATGVLLHDSKRGAFRKMILQGGPGQGKSTITQMAAQIYREQVLGEDQIMPEGRWSLPEKTRLPFRVELRKLAEWLNGNPGGSIESYLSTVIAEDSGGNTISVNDIQTAVEKSPVMLMFDGLDEIGSDKLRDDVLKAIMECVNRFENDLKSDLRVVVTTRPPALAGRTEILNGFERLSLAPMGKRRIDEYINRWLSVQIQEEEEKYRIRTAYERREDEPHVQALARNPMQLSVLLQFIRLKGEAFPDRRAELYKEYFQIVIDRDVEKSAKLRENRPVIQALHEFVGYRIHGLTEIKQADRTLDRARLIGMVEEWLRERGDRPEMALEFFKLGEERFGLVVASSGEGEETRYGYEVQPIQEYFAAAYISNQMPMDSGAHDAFERMLHRPYWREVALFLAGLRRPNEKADLILRASNVDRDREMGWRQDGRTVIFLLLQEGVFSEPPYVYSQALEFVLELLDARNLKVQREPSGLIEGLEMLANSQSTDRHKEKVLGLLKDYATCTDEYVMVRLFRIAGQLLTANEYLKAALSYKGQKLALAALIRLGWLYNRRIDVQEMSQNHLFWNGVPNYIWAQVWWHEATHWGVAFDLKAPREVHQHLVEEFAATGIPTTYFGPEQPSFTALSKLAIWKMYRNQQVLQITGFLGEAEEPLKSTLREEFLSTCENGDELDYTGLEESVRAAVQDLIRLSNELIRAYCSEGAEKVALSADQYLGGIRHYLENSGLTAWIACQCAVNFTTCWLDRPRHRGLGKTVDEKAVRTLVNEVRSFYVPSKFRDDHRRGHGIYDFLKTSRWGAYPPYHGPVVRCIRLEESGPHVDLADIILDCVSHKKDLPFGWMKVMPLSAEVLRSSIEKCQTNLDELLEMTGGYRIIGMPARPLRVQDTQRILKVARHTDKAVTLAGASAALSNASFLRVGETELILKILRADLLGNLGTGLFLGDKPSQGDPDTGVFAKEIELTEKIARNVVDNADVYPFWTVCAAAGFLAQYFPLRLPPLLHSQ